jgi:hypothetical protein
MTNFKSITLSTLFSVFFFSSLFAQQTYMSASNKMSSLLDIKLLKTGELVLLEQIWLCGNANVKILNPDGSEEIILTSGNAKFYSFNELADNNWVLVLITDPADDVFVPYTFHTITFINGGFTIFTSYDDQTDIDLRKISGAAVYNENELVLRGFEKIYFTDFQLTAHQEVILDENLSILKSPFPSSNYLYFIYEDGEDLKQTDDRFATDFVIPYDLEDSYMDIHIMGQHIIFQNETEISVTFGLGGFVYFEQNNKIYNFRQHGQNLTYYTISIDNIHTFSKLYLDENEELQKDSFNLDLKEVLFLRNLHWDGNFKGFDYTFFPLPSEDYEDEYRGQNYVLNYNMEDFDLTTQNLDVLIDNIEYTTSVDTTFVGGYYEIYYADIEMQITVTNNTDQIVNDVHLYSAAFEGINCSHNYLKVDDNIIPIAPFGSKVVNARYKSLQFGSSGLQHPLCVYVLGANNKFDDNFNDNIYCLPLLELTSIEDELEEVNFSVYPNPAQDNIQVDSKISNSAYIIYTLQGQKVAEWEKDSANRVFDISDLDQGTYLIIEQKTNKTRLFSKI